MTRVPAGAAQGSQPERSHFVHPRRLANDFGAFTRIFADILKVKNDSALVAQNQLTHGGTMLRYKLDDLASKAARAPGRDP